MGDMWRLAWRFAGGAGRAHRGRVAVSATLAAIAMLLCCIGISVVQVFQHAETVAASRQLHTVAPTQASALVASGDITILGGDTVEVLWVEPRGSRTSAAESVGLPQLPSYGHYLVSPALRDVIDDLNLERLMPVDGVLPVSEVVAGQELYAVRTVRQAPATDFYRPQPVDGVGTYTDPANGSYTVDIVPPWQPALVICLLLGLPAVLLLTTAARLGAPVRQHRVVLMSALGAGRQARRIAAVESVLLLGVGVIAGLVLWAALAPQLTSVPLVGFPLLEGAWRLTWAHVGVAIALLATTWVAGLTLAGAPRRRRADEGEQLSPVRLMPVSIGVVGMLVTPWFGHTNRMAVFVASLLVAALGVVIVLPRVLRRLGHGLRPAEALPVFLAGAAIQRFPRRSARGWGSMALACAIFAPAMVFAGLNAQGDTDEVVSSWHPLTMVRLFNAEPRDLAAIDDPPPGMYIGLQRPGKQRAYVGTCRSIARELALGNCHQLDRQYAAITEGGDFDARPGRARKGRVVVISTADEAATYATLGRLVDKVLRPRILPFTSTDNPSERGQLVPWILAAMGVAIGSAMLAIMLLVIDRGMTARDRTPLERIGLSLRRRRLADAVRFGISCWAAAGAGLAVGLVGAIVFARDELGAVFPWGPIVVLVAIVAAISLAGAAAAAIGSNPTRALHSADD